MGACQVPIAQTLEVHSEHASHKAISLILKGYICTNSRTSTLQGSSRGYGVLLSRCSIRRDCLEDSGAIDVVDSPVVACSTLNCVLLVSESLRRLISVAHFHNPLDS